MENSKKIKSFVTLSFYDVLVDVAVSTVRPVSSGWRPWMAADIVF